MSVDWYTKVNYKQDNRLNKNLSRKKGKPTIDIILGKHAYDRMKERIGNGITTYSETIEMLNNQFKHGGILYHEPHYPIKRLRYPKMNGGTFIITQSTENDIIKDRYFAKTYSYELEKRWNRNPVKVYWHEMDNKDLVDFLNDESYTPGLY